MHTILVINCGSSSIKYEVYRMPDRESIGKGLIERIGQDMGHICQKRPDGRVYDSNAPMPDHKAAMEHLKSALIDGEAGLISSMAEIHGVGHRVVHGGEEYSTSVTIDDKVIAAIEKNIELAPLHNPANLIGIREAMNQLPDCTQVAVFDTAFHQTLSPAAYLYGLPREFYDKYRIRRYGFHGTSHRYVSGEAIKLMKRHPSNTNVISCHLGNGASITAIANGKSMDTSMGFTPLEGVVMGTRSGDIDPQILFYLMERGFSKEDLNRILNKESGMLGLSGISNDMRDIEEAAASGNKQCREALDVYAYRIRKYIGAFAANMVRTDILVFTGGIGENSVKMRERICHRLESLGIILDDERNRENGNRQGVISADYSKTAICVVPTNEELQIASDTYEIIDGA
ncbi:acetate kinase [Marispirochaeta aestuarii]|uniref:acetate/propionate family kinase n=1 Tax=Marispirochaeta aestuarii TaxID=1963862 RepID=UPI0029C7AA19|nr:acetate kinase [Marispirochaeta aestuarii]